MRTLSPVTASQVRCTKLSQGASDVRCRAPQPADEVGLEANWGRWKSDVSEWASAGLKSISPDDNVCGRNKLAHHALVTSIQSNRFASLRIMELGELLCLGEVVARCSYGHRNQRHVWCKKYETGVPMTSSTSPLESSSSTAGLATIPDPSSNALLFFGRAPDDVEGV